MAGELEKLIGLIESPCRHDIPFADLLPLQIEAANERLAEHGRTIQFVRKRIDETGIGRIADVSNLPSLLFAHTVYKGYPESWLNNGRWDLLGRWLETVSTSAVSSESMADAGGIDGWIELLAAAGVFVSCSSGTSGKVSMIPSVMADRQVVRRNLVYSLSHSTGLDAGHHYKVFICNPGSNNFRYLDSWDALVGAFGRNGEEFRFPGEAITVGGVRDMVGLRNRISSGEARPDDLASYETLVKHREGVMA
ncbi:MAG: hypothetical protein KDJ29_20075, partial [Hyphomicrobiales bacterium]|nr:hypothetical protein [Hyphomicrobiales bacterium]